MRIDRGSKARNHAAGLDEAVFGGVKFLRLQEVVELDAKVSLLAGSVKPGEEDGDVKDFFEG